MKRKLIVAAVAVCMSLPVGSVAAAEPNQVEQVSVSAVSQPSIVTAEGYRSLLDALKKSGADTKDGMVTYTLPGYGEIAFAEPTQGVEGPQHLGGGWSGWSGPYVSFNRTDQGALLAGGGAALAASICLIPAVGQVACVAAAALVTAGFYYLNESGRCPTSKPNLRVYVWDRSHIGCYG